ncbi:MAG TPA: hypothetical protein VI756_17825, partial [Blastocatellia bacterium]
MNTFHSSSTVRGKRGAIGIVAILFALSVVLYAKQDTKKPPTPPAKTAVTKPAPTKAPPTKPGTGTNNTAGANKTPGGTNPSTGGSVGTPRNGGTSATPMGLTKGANGKPVSYRGRDGSEAHFGKNGGVREIRAHGMVISHGPGGTRRFATERTDHSGVFANQAGHGFVQHPFIYRGHTFVSRTYFVGGRPYPLYYQGYYYRGGFLVGYAPFQYYPLGFYGWAYNPWLTPIGFGWGWYGSPWYGYYGSYFAPYPTYPSASYWLTDYVISQDLQAAYQEQLDAQAAQAGANAQPAGGPVTLTPEVKAAIATEVQSELALENSEAQTQARGGDIDINSSGLPRILAETSPAHPHVFIVSSPIVVTDVNGQECNLTEGDVIRLSTPPPAIATSANVQIFASKSQECPAGTTVAVSLSDLQDMQNSMRATIDQGLE